MDSRFWWPTPHISSSPINALENPINIRFGAKNNTDTTLRLDSPGSSGLYCFSSKGIKRKWDDVDGAEDQVNASLVLGLGRSASSSDSSKKSSATVCTMSSAKESDEECSMDLGLSFEINLGNEIALTSKKPAVSAAVLLESKPKLDLQLSLSVGPSLSGVTSVAPISAHHQLIFDKPIMIPAVPTVDEGSTSSRWKHGNNLLPYLSTVENSNGYVPNQTTDEKSEPAGITCAKTTACIPSPDTSTSGITQPQHRNSNTKNCQHPGCVKGARGASGLCIAHGGGRRCLKTGCNKGAEGKTIFCKAHGGGRRCQHLGCTKSAEGRTDYCIAHGGGRRCNKSGCLRAARGKSGLCIRHGGGKRCQRENCTKSAEGHSGLCISHGGGRRCKYPECTKGAQGSTNFCKAHGGGKRCTYPGCTKGAEGSTSFCKGHGGGKRCAFEGGCSKSVHGGTHFCVAHGGGKRCAIPECTKSARGRTDFCVRHGGGKRCKFEGCGKSAQGSTDFCKAHGGGKRCTWGQPGSTLGAGTPPCDRFARGKNGFCAAHNALVEDHRVHGGYTLEAVMPENTAPGRSEKMKEVVHGGMLKIENATNYQFGTDRHEANGFVHPVSSLNSGAPSLPEGRVHGGGLLAMLAGAGGTNTGKHSEGQLGGGRPEQDREFTVSHNWY